MRALSIFISICLFPLLTISAQVAANFASDRTSGSEPLFIHFSDSSTTANDSIVNWFWDFNDGSTSNFQHPSHTFESGLYTICLTVTDNTGAADTLCKNNFIESLIDTIPPVLVCPNNRHRIAAPGECTSTILPNVLPDISGINGFFEIEYIVSGATTASNSGSVYGLLFHHGISTVEYLVTDQAGKCWNL